MIIMVHGIGDSGSDMAPITNALAGQLPTFAPSRRPLPASATFDDTVEDFVKQIDEADVGPAFLLGYSFGGLVALTAARRYPDRVRGVIGLAPKVIYDARTMNHLRHIISVPHLMRLGPQRVKAYEERWGMDLATLTKSAMTMYESFYPDPPLSDDDLRAINVPVLIVSGDIDQVTPAAEARLLGALIPQARVEFFPGMAHPMSQVPAPRVAEAVVRFVNEVEEGVFGAAPRERAAG